MNKRVQGGGLFSKMLGCNKEENLVNGVCTPVQKISVIPKQPETQKGIYGFYRVIIDKDDLDEDVPYDKSEYSNASNQGVLIVKKKDDDDYYISGYESKDMIEKKLKKSVRYKSFKISFIRDYNKLKIIIEFYYRNNVEKVTEPYVCVITLPDDESCNSCRVLKNVANTLTRGDIKTDIGPPVYLNYTYSQNNGILYNLIAKTRIGYKEEYIKYVPLIVICSILELLVNHPSNFEYTITGGTPEEKKDNYNKLAHALSHMDVLDENLSYIDKYRELMKTIFFASQQNGGKKCYQKTMEKVSTRHGIRCVYKGKRGGKYVKVKGEYVRLKDVQKQK